MTESAVVFITRYKEDKLEVLLGKRKSKSYATGKWNGFGGKKEGSETAEEIAIRETYEECGVTIKKEALCKVAEIFYQEPQGDWSVTAFLVSDYSGQDPEETLEMFPRWFPVDKLPLDEMWENDKLWLPKILSGEKLTGTIINDENGKLVKHQLQKQQ